jgi:hypothetical protein
MICFLYKQEIDQELYLIPSYKVSVFQDPDIFLV